MLTQVMNGIAYGGLLYLMAAGLVLIFGLRQIVNFAHGSLFMIGAYLAFSGAQLGSFWLGMLAAVVLLGAVGVLLDRAVFQPLRSRDHTVTVLVTFGLLLVAESVVLLGWGKELRSVKIPELLEGSVVLWESSFPIYRLFVIVVSLAVGAGLWAWLRYTRTGLFVRAASYDAEITALQGVNTDRLSLIVVGLGAALAGFSGVIAAPLFALSPTMGSTVLIETFIVVVVGGLGSFSGAFVAAMAIGLIHNFGVIYVPWAATMIPFLIMSAVLMLRPQGLSGARH
jgi:branched-chain amino acid transport system permease protein